MLTLSPVAVLLVTPDLLKRGVWPINGNVAPVVPVRLRPYELFRSKDWVGAKIIGSGIVVELIRACAGLTHWNEWEPSLPGWPAFSRREAPRSGGRHRFMTNSLIQA